MTYTIIHGDALERLRKMPSESVQCVVTSPPYFGLRDYGMTGQLGLEATPEEYVARMVEVFREVHRVLRSDGTLWLVLGDSYTSGGRSSFDITARRRPEFPESGRNAHPAAGKTRPATPMGLKPKDLMGIPWRVALALQSDGAADPAHMRTIEGIISAVTASYESREEWPVRIRQQVEHLEREWVDVHRGGWWLRSDIIWSKPNPMPESVTDRPTKSHEYVFLLTKSAKYFWDAEAVREPHTEVSLARARRNRFGRKYDGSDSAEHSQLKMGRNYGPDGDPDKVCSPGGRNIRSVWTIATAPFPEAHFAVFPPKLVEPMIKAGTSERGCCAECGAPWVRVVERGKSTRAGPVASGFREASARSDPGANVTCGTTVSTTTGWRPSCECEGDPEPVPCTILDPFAGAFTTGLVALRMERDFVGIELNPSFCEMGELRINKYLNQTIELSDVRRAIRRINR